MKKDGREISEIVFFGNICAKEYLEDDRTTRKLFEGRACILVTWQFGMRIVVRRFQIGQGTLLSLVRSLPLPTPIP
jgi:hypothetical protein